MTRISGNMVNYYFVCQRKLWLFCHELKFEDESERVRLGKILDENSYSRNEKHIMLDNVVNIDMIESWKVIHEIKKTKSIEKSAEWQLKYYMYYLKQRGIEIEKGILDYPKIKERFEFQLTKEDETKIRNLLKKIESVIYAKQTPHKINSKICKSCAYFEYCYS